MEWTVVGNLRLRITKVDEYQFLSCLKHSLWGSKSARFSNWQKGDLLVFIVEKALSGYAEVTGLPFQSNEKVWDNGLFPYRVPIKFKYTLAKDQRIPILGEIRDILISKWGNSYGWGILNQQLITDSAAEKIVNEFAWRPNNLEQTQSNLEQYLKEAAQLRNNDAFAQAEKRQTLRSEKMSLTEEKEKEATTERLPLVEEDSGHSKAQNALIELGRITGCSVWVASNDRNRSFNGKALGEQCLEQLPNMGLNDEATRKIALIDIIWIKQNAPVCAFEVETTTSIYSGILRMSDLISVVPALNVKLYIVAPKERQDKVVSELTRPTFKRIGLNDFCKFIPLDELLKLLAKVEDLGGHVYPTIVDKIAISYGEEI
jgi:hypothetical protein